MVDSFKCEINKSENGISRDWLRRASCLTFKSKKAFASSEYYKLWGFRNLRVTESRTALKVEGSLPKFRYEHNLFALSRSELSEVIDEISDLINLPIWKGKLLRLDIGRNFILKCPTKSYLNCLTDTPFFMTYTRMSGESKRYGSSNHQLIFYDKILQMIKKDEFIPSGYHELNILRYELQVQKHLAQQFGYSNLKVVHLKSPTFLAKVEKLWRTSYFKVFKNNSVFLPCNITLKGFENYLFYNGIRKSGGVESVISKANDIYKNGNITYAQKRHFFKTLRLRFADYDLIREADLLKEVESQIVSPFFR